MAHIWKVGDKAACISVDAYPLGKDAPQCIKLGRVYLVDSVGIAKYSGNVALSLSGVIPDTLSGLIGAWRFRPIVKADDDFIAQMRSLKPKVKQ